MRKTKIVATIGPASVERPVLDEIVSSGLDVARLNASHLDDRGLAETFEAVRAASERAGRPIGIVVDLPGAKLRVGDMRPESLLEAGASFDIEAADCVGDSDRACVSWEGLWRDLSPSDRVLLDDGRIVLEVTSTEPGCVHTRVRTGGVLKGRKGVNVPGVRLSLSGVTRRDHELAEWARDVGADFVAQSFIRGPEDIADIRAVLGPDGPALIAKIEKHEAVAAVAEIVAAADAVMVARGDLGVEMPVEQVPVLQRAIVAAARSARKPVIVATQMLESMVRDPSPTRAEASDVATAIFEGADAVMLSAETAVGAYPIEAVCVMRRIAEAAETAFLPPDDVTAVRSRDVAGAVSAAVVRLAENLDVGAIVTLTRSGATARAVAGLRPYAPVIAATTEIETARQLTLVWGVTPVDIEHAQRLETMLMAAVDAARTAGLVKAGDLVALTAGVAVGVSGGTDLIRVITA
jgi:pyruvate kinase